MKKHKIVEGWDYPKDKILELIDIFGLTVEIDKWDEPLEDSSFMKIISTKYLDAGNIYLHKHHLEFAVHHEREHLKSLFQDFLIEIGEREFKKKLNELITL